jgi:MFS superfamily sulfate permease-like transporter
LLSRPVLIGYMNRIALLMIVRQLGNLTGAPVDRGSVTYQLRSVVTLHVVQPPTLAVGSAYSQC